MSMDRKLLEELSNWIIVAVRDHLKTFYFEAEECKAIEGF